MDLDHNGGPNVFSTDCNTVPNAEESNGHARRLTRTLDEQLVSNDSMNSRTTAVKEQNKRDQALLAYYKCPEDFCDIELSGEPSAEQGFFQFGPRTLCYGRCDVGKPVNHLVGPLFDVSAACETKQGVVRLPFDLDEVVDNLRRERYALEGTASARSHIFDAISHHTYYFLRPWLPVFVRKYIQRFSLRGWRRIEFPQWPVDRTVDAIFENALVLCMKARRMSSIPFIWFWPNGAQSCAMMTHDVETSTGLQFCHTLMDVDDSFNLKSSFQFVPEERYVASDELLDELRSRGFEVNIQDLNHDGNLFRDREEFLRRASRINEYLRRFRSQGFRSAIMYRNADWLDAIQADYDMSFPTVAHLEAQNGGCCTIMPYFIGKMVELPLTTVQDYSLVHILGEHSIDIWARQIDLIRQKNGLISFIVHPDYLKRPSEMALYKTLLNHLSRLRAEGTLWVTLPREVAAWWRARNQMKLVFRDGKPRIEGEESERACIAYATLTDQGVAYSF